MKHFSMVVFLTDYVSIRNDWRFPQSPKYYPSAEKLLWGLTLEVGFGTKVWYAKTENWQPVQFGDHALFERQQTGKVV